MDLLKQFKFPSPFTRANLSSPQLVQDALHQLNTKPFQTDGELLCMWFLKPSDDPPSVDGLGSRPRRIAGVRTLGACGGGGGGSCCARASATACLAASHARARERLRCQAKLPSQQLLFAPRPFHAVSFTASIVPGPHNAAPSSPIKTKKQQTRRVNVRQEL